MRKEYIDNNAVSIKRQYEITQVNGIDFLTIKKGSSENIYDPLAFESNLKRPIKPEDHLDFGPHVALARINPNKVEEILDFVNKWGLLGLGKTEKYSNLHWLSELIDSDDFFKEYHHSDDLFKNAKRRRGERDREPVVVLQQAIRDYQQMIEGLFRFRSYKAPDIFKSKKEKGEIAVRVIDIFGQYVENKLQQYEGERSSNLITEFLNEPDLRDEKGKPISQDLRRKMEAILNEQSLATEVYFTLNQMLKESSSQIFWDLEKSTESRGWTFNSLLAAVYLRTSLDLEEGKEFKRCEWHKCSRLFILHRPDTKTCSSRCRSSLNVYNHNLEKYLALAIQEFPAIPPENVKATLKHLLDQGYSGKKKLLRELSHKLT